MENSVKDFFPSQEYYSFFIMIPGKKKSTDCCIGEIGKNDDATAIPYFISGKITL